MGNLIEIIEIITKEQFLEDWEKQDGSNENPDQFSSQRRKEHETYTGLKYYTAILTKIGLENLVLWYHVCGKDNQPRIESGGELFWDVVSHYQQQVPQNQPDSCLEKIWRIRQELDAKFQESANFLKTDYSLGRIFNQRKLAIRNETYYRDHGEGKLYAGNIHRFLGYGLWVKEFGYQPIKVHYCEASIVL